MMPRIFHDWPTIELFPGGLILDGHILTNPKIDDFKSKIEEEPRVETKLSSGKPWRNVLIFDASGIYAVEGVEDNRIIYIGIAFVPPLTPFPPRKPFSGRLMINKTTVTPGMAEKDLPLKGEMNFVSGIGQTWKYVHDNGYVELNLKKLATDQRATKRLGLVSVTHSFLV